MKQFRVLFFYALVLTSLLVALTGSQPVYASSLIVNSPADITGTCSTTGIGTCTLRDAITYANANGGGVITFAGNYTITLGSQQLPTVNTTIVINGNGAANTVIQASTCDPITLPGSCTPATYRVFENGTGNLTLNGLTVQFGDCALVTSSCADIQASGGGALNNGGTLTVTNSTFYHNTGDAGGGIVNNTGTLNVSNSTFSGNSSGQGGGIYNAGPATVTDSTFSDNFAQSNGGGIYNIVSTLTVKNGTFASNHATSGIGGGIYNSNTLTVTNSTFSGNTATHGGGVENYTSGTLTLTNNTLSGSIASISGGGGGIENRSLLYMANNIVANSANGDCLNNWIISTNSHNLIMDGSCSGPSNLSGDPKLGTLASNGGPTQTIAIPLNSPAIDAGDDNTCKNAPINNLDQRGIVRPQGVHCDIGAFEQVDLTAPYVLSVTRVNPSPTNLSSVDFTVTFSEIVTGVDTSDFTLTTTGVSSAAVSGVSGSGSVYTVTVSTGTGNGNIRLDMVNNGTIKDAALNPLAAGFTGGESYLVIKSPTFADVPFSYWAWSFIERLYNAGITGGCSTVPLNYCPDSTVTRAQMAVFLLKGMHGSSFTPPAVGVSTGFTDVATDYWAAAWIKQLASEGITGGCGAGIYCPDATVTRAQMAVFLLKAKHGSSYSPPSATGVFSDVPVGYWADKWIEQLAAEGVTSGCGAGIYCPDADVTRAQMAVFLVKAFNLP